MSLTTVPLKYGRISDPGPQTEYMKCLETETGFIDYSDIAQLALTKAQREDVEQKFHKIDDKTGKCDACEDLSNSIYKQGFNAEQ